MSRLRVGVVGFGAIAELGHVPAMLALAPRVTVEAVVDRSEQRRQAARRLPDVRLVAASVDELLRAGPALDLVVTALPPGANGAAASAVAAAGYQVLAEKPLAARAADAQRLLAAPGVADRVSVVHNYLFRTDVAAAIETLRAGRLGAVRMVRLERPDNGHFVGAGHEPHWRRAAAHDGGCLRDNAYHWIYLAEAFTRSEVVRSAAWLAHNGTDSAEDIAALLFRHEGGALTTVTTAWCTRAAQPVLEIHGADASLRLLGDGDRCEISRGDGWLPVPGAVGVSSYERMYRHLLDVGIGADPRLRVDQGMRVLHVIDQLYAAADQPLQPTGVN